MFPPNGEGSRAHRLSKGRRPARRTSYPNLSFVVHFDVEPGGDGDAEVNPQDWPAWTDAPVEFLDYESFDNAGNLIKGGA